MNINVKSCSSCPFLVSDYDDYSVGYDTLDYCNLARFIKSEEDIIDVYNSYEKEVECDYCKNLQLDETYNEELCKCNELYNELEDSKEKPDWCPLNKEEIIIR